MAVARGDGSGSSDGHSGRAWETVEPDIPTTESELAPFEGRFPGVSGSLREHTARGTIVNAAFRVSVAVLLLLRRILVAAFLTPAELGVWGIVLITVITLMFIKNAGISDKFIQQSEKDQEAAFQKAFTIEFLLTAGFVLLAGYVTLVRELVRRELGVEQPFELAA